MAFTSLLLLPPASVALLVAMVVVVIIIIVIIIITVVQMKRLVLDLDWLLDLSRKTAGSCLPAKPQKVCEQHPMPAA